MASRGDEREKTTGEDDADADDVNREVAMAVSAIEANGDLSEDEEAETEREDEDAGEMKGEEGDSDVDEVGDVTAEVEEVKAKGERDEVTWDELDSAEGDCGKDE